MQAEMIKREAIRLKAKYQTSDPYEICDALRIRLMLCPMGTGDGSCKGFFLKNARRKAIVLNCDLPEHIRRIILGHELGHAWLHSSAAISTFHEVSLFDDTDQMEKEENEFAAEFFLDDDDVLEVLDPGTDFLRAASILRVPPELLDFKLRCMERQGYKLRAPYIAFGDFLKRNIDRPLY